MFLKLLIFLVSKLVAIGFAILLAHTIAAQSIPAGSECQKVRKFRGNDSIETVLCRGPDGVLREPARQIGSSGNAFRGRLSYTGSYAGTAQPISRQRNTPLTLQGLLRGALNAETSKTSVSGDLSLVLEVSGQSVRGSLTLRGARSQTWNLAGIAEGGACRLADQSQTLVLTGKCGLEEFDGALATDPDSGQRYRLQVAARLTSRVDFDERDLARAAERLQQEQKLAADRLYAERWQKEQFALAQAGDVKAMYLLAEA